VTGPRGDPQMRHFPIPTLTGGTGSRCDHRCPALPRYTPLALKPVNIFHDGKNPYNYSPQTFARSVSPRSVVHWLLLRTLTNDQ
jgi:hypothetical protein